MAIAVLSVWLAACRSEAGRDPAGCRGEAAQVVDPVLLAYLSKARSVHLLADHAESDGQPEQAIAELALLASAPPPGGQDPAPEAREILADTFARLADLKAQKADFDGAKADIDRGLSLATAPTHYRGRLFEVLGTVEKRRYQRLKETGDEAGARAAKERSIAALKQAIAIQEKVIQSALRK